MTSSLPYQRPCAWRFRPRAIALPARSHDSPSDPYAEYTAPSNSHFSPMMKWGRRKKVPVFLLIVSVRNLERCVVVR